MFKKILIANRGENGRQAGSAKPKRDLHVSAKPKRDLHVSAKPKRDLHVSAKPNCVARAACAGDLAAGSQHV